MALNAYLVLTGETQGKVNGSVTQAGREDSIEIYDVKHGVLAPVDAASGLPTGKRQHKPITVTKPLEFFFDGKQYLAMFVSGSGKPTELVAYALP